MNSNSSGNRRVCMLTHSFYESDNRVMRYAETLALRGDTVEVLALRRSQDSPQEETIGGVRVFRIQDRFGKSAQSRRLDFLWPLLRFLAVSSWWLARRHHRRPYDLVHVHNVPDFLVFAAWYPRLTGARIILDIHDILPEFYASKFRAAEKSSLVRVLKLVERLSAGFASHIILANHLWLEKYTRRSARPGKCSVVLNHVDERIFFRRTRQGLGEPAVVMFPGGLQWHQGLDIALRAFAKLRCQLPQAQFHIYGEGDMKGKLVSLAEDLELNGSVRFFNPLPIQQIAGVMAEADLAVVPKRADSFGNEAYSTKIMEFMSLGVPLVISRTKVDQYYFNDSVVRFFDSGNDEALAKAMLEVLTNQELRHGLVRKASEYVSLNGWKNRQGDYLALVDRLCTGKGAAGLQALAAA